MTYNQLITFIAFILYIPTQASGFSPLSSPHFSSDILFLKKSPKLPKKEPKLMDMSDQFENPDVHVSTGEYDKVECQKRCHQDIHQSESVNEKEWAMFSLVEFTGKLKDNKNNLLREKIPPIGLVFPGKVKGSRLLALWHDIKFFGWIFKEDILKNKKEHCEDFLFMTTCFACALLFKKFGEKI